MTDRNHIYPLCILFDMVNFEFTLLALKLQILQNTGMYDPWDMGATYNIQQKFSQANLVKEISLVCDHH